MIAGALTNVVFGFLRAAVLRTAMGNQVVGGMDRNAATGFVFLTQAMIAVTSLFGDMALIASVRSGDVATELHRPWDWSTYRLSYDLGKSTYQLISRSLLITMVGWVAYQLAVPPLDRVAWFLLTVFLAAVLASRIWTISGLSAFWVVDATGVVQFAVMAALFGTGLLVPLQILPASVESVLLVLPFASLVQGPADVVLGLRSPVVVIALQVMWIVILEVVLRVILRSATRKLEVQGG
jgi:ABC-2 type transport system permease protein